MESVKQQPYYPRIKRILMGFQDSAKHSLNGPSDTGADDNAQTNVDAAISSSSAVKPEAAASDESRWTSTNGGRDGGPASGSRRRPSADVSKTLQLSETRVEGEKISCFRVGGEARLCLPQLLSRVLFSIPPASLQSVTDSLHIYFAECVDGQLEMLKQAGVLPNTVPRSGLVTLTDALRICAVLLHDQPPRHETPSDMTPMIPVAHECFGGCRGMFWPYDYRSPSSLCVECAECRGWLSPEQFISHSHTVGENRTCHWGFDSRNWRSYLMLAAADDQFRLQHLLDKMKQLFVAKEHQEVLRTVR